MARYCEVLKGFLKYEEVRYNSIAILFQSLENGFLFVTILQIYILKILYYSSGLYFSIFQMYRTSKELYHASVRDSFLFDSLNSFNLFFIKFFPPFFCLIPRVIFPFNWV